MGGTYVRKRRVGGGRKADRLGGDCGSPPPASLRTAGAIRGAAGRVRSAGRLVTGGQPARRPDAIRSTTAEVNSVVPACPPRSGVLVPDAIVSSAAA